MNDFRIAIIGAGPAGSTLGRLLHKANIQFVIFEGEESASVRGQGGTLDLHANSGQAALKACGLYDEFIKHCRYDGEAMVIADKFYRKYINEKGKTKETKWGRPEIDREKLRNILLESLPTDAVKWGNKVVSIEDLRPGFALRFEDGSRDSGFDLIVGADGAFSRARPVLSDVKPYYAGIGGVWGLVPDAENRYPELHRQVNRGSLFAFSDGRSIIAQQLGDGSLNVSAAWVRPSDWNTGTQRTKEELKQAALMEYIDWDSRLTALFEAADVSTIVSRNLYMLPIGHKWKHRPGLTLIGDAAHLATPYAGEGVNLAMADSLKLAQAIVSASQIETTQDTISREQVLSDEIRNFEEDMFTRATAMQQMTKDMMDAMLFTPGAPYTGIEKYIYSALSDSLPWGTHGAAYGLICSAYWIYKKFFLPAEPQTAKRLE